MRLFRDNEKKFKRNITRLGIPTGRRRISWLFHMCGRGFELGTTAIQSSQRSVGDLNSGSSGLQVQRFNLSATLLPHIVKLLRILPLLDWVLFSRFSAPPNLQVKTLATSFIISSWWEIDSGNDVKSVMCYRQIAFSGDFLFPPRKK